MTRLSWTNGNERLYETGLDRGVLYPKNGSAVVWNGLTSVEEKGSDSATAYYLDGRPYLYYTPPKEYEATLNAYTYPDEFSALMGLEEEEHVPGFYLDSQVASTFDLSYRTLIGSAAEGVDHGYKIHLVYNAIVAPQGNSYETLSDSINPSTFSWTINAVPEKISGYRPTAHIVINTKNMSEDDVALVEDILYGTDSEPAAMPSASVVLDKLRYGDVIIITDNGDGTWTAEGGSYNIYQTSDTTFTVQNVDAVDNGDGTFDISSVTVPGDDSVETITQAEADRIEANIVVSGEVINGGLFLTTKGGTVLNVGQAAQLPDGTDGTQPEVFVTLSSFDSPEVEVGVPEWATPFAGPTRLPTITPQPSNSGYAVSWSPDGRYLAVGSYNNPPFVSWYKRAGDSFTRMTTPASQPASIAQDVKWSPDGQYLAVAGYSGQTLLIYKRSGDTLTALTLPAILPVNGAMAVEWSPDGKYLIVGCVSGTYLYVYKFENEVLTRISDPDIAPTGQVNDISWSPDGSCVVIAHNVTPFVTAYTFSAESLSKISNPTTLPASNANAVDWSPNGTYLLVVSLTNSRLYKLVDGVLTLVYAPAYGGQYAIWSPDGKYVCFSSAPDVVVTRIVGVIFYKMPDPILTPVTTTAYGLAWSPDGRHLAVAGFSSTSVYLTVYKSQMQLPPGLPINAPID